MQYTASFSLRKPEYTDILDVADLNFNVDAIDAALGNYLPLAGGAITGTVTLKNNVAIRAENASGAAVMAIVRDASNDIQVGSTAVSGGNVVLTTASSNAVYHQAGSSTRYQILDTNNATDLHDHRQLYRVGSTRTTQLYIISQGTALCTDEDNVLTLGIASRRFDTIFLNRYDQHIGRTRKAGYSGYCAGQGACDGHAAAPVQV